MPRKAKAKPKPRKAKPRERFVTICPKCGSMDVQGDTNPSYASSGLTQFKQCNSCGHHGQFFPEVPESRAPKNPKRPAEVRDRQLVNPSYGQGEVGILRITGPLATISSILITLFDSSAVVRMLAILFLLPTGIFATAVGFRKEKIAKSEFLRAFCIMMIIYIFAGYLMLVAFPFLFGKP